MSSTRKTSTARTRAYRERVKRGGKVLPFRARNMVEEPDDPADRVAGTWGPNHDRPPMTASNFDWKEGRGKLRAVFVLRVPSWNVMIAGCRLMRWGGPGERVLLPQSSWSTKPGRRIYEDQIIFTSDLEMRLFEEEALRAVRRARRDMPPPVAGPRQKVIDADRGNPDADPDDGVARSGDDVPF